MDLGVKRSSVGQDDQSWLGSAHGTQSTQTITLDRTTFTAATHYPEGWLKSGLPLMYLRDESGQKVYGLWGAMATPAAWAATTAYAVGDIRRLSGGAYLRATVAGTSAAAAPSAPDTVGDTVVDGTVTWERVATENTLSGFLFTPVQASADRVGGAILEHGRVKTAKLPVAVNVAAQGTAAGRIIFA